MTTTSLALLNIAPGQVVQTDLDLEAFLDADPEEPPYLEYEGDGLVRRKMSPNTDPRRPCRARVRAVRPVAAADRPAPLRVRRAAHHLGQTGAAARCLGLSRATARECAKARAPSPICR